MFARRKDGSEFPVEVGLNPIETPQGLLVLASVVDISARKAAEEEARQRREQVELLSRASLLGEMTASLAHELNQPLSAIKSNANAGMLFIEKGKVDVDQLHEIFQDVVADSRRAHQIVQNVRNAIKKGARCVGGSTSTRSSRPWLTWCSPMPRRIFARWRWRWRKNYRR